MFDDDLVSTRFTCHHPPTHLPIHSSPHPLISPSTHLPIHSYPHPPTHPPRYPYVYIHSPIHTINQTINVSTHLPIHPFTHPTHPSTHSLTHPYINHQCIHSLIHPLLHTSTNSCSTQSTHPYPLLHTYKDIIDPDSLLTDEDLRRPDPLTLRSRQALHTMLYTLTKDTLNMLLGDCGTGKDGKKKACKNCTCGLADELEGKKTKTATSACGNVSFIYK